MTERTAMSLWPEALPLNEAPFAFAATSLRDAYEERRRDLGSMDGVYRTLDRAGLQEDVRRTNIGALATLGAMAALAFARPSELEQDVAAKLASGRLLAIGFAEPRTPDTLPTFVPADIWHGDIQWKSDAVKGNGLSFVAVRVLSADTPGVSEESKPGPADQIPSGRPGVAREILKAYKALRAEGRIDWAEPRAWLHQPIRDWLAKQYPKRAEQWRKLSDRTLAKHLKTPFDADAAHRRMNKTE